MGKAPAFQFYVRDWLSDPQLRQTSPATRGIWIDMLCFMWESPERGELTGTTETMSRMLGVTHSEFATFLEEAETLNFASVTFANKKVTVTNRRMKREEQAKKSHRNRQRRYKERQQDTPNDAQNDAKVTPLSSSSSSSSTSKNKDMAEKTAQSSPKKSPKKFVPPTEKEVVKYSEDNGYPSELGQRVFKYYSSANWKDSRGKQVKNWKQKMQGVWFRPENLPKQDFRPSPKIVTAPEGFAADG